MLLLGNLFPIFAFICIKSVDAAFEFKMLKQSKSEPVSNETLPYKQVTYDNEGTLCINGTFPGISDPIVVDKKTLSRYCAVKPFYVFSVCPALRELLINKNSVCPEGIIFCYDGQLTDLNVLEQFVLPYNENDEITQKCKGMNGFKMAVHYLPWMKEQRPTDGYGNFFMEIKTSYLTESYYFPLPKSNCMDLSMGNSDNLLTGVRSVENDNKLVHPVQVRLQANSKLVGHYKGNKEKFIEDFTKLPDHMRMKKYSSVAHLNMLYLDFRAPPLVPQMMRAIVPETECNLLIRVRGNTIKECRSEFKQKNYALRSFKDNRTTTTYGLTIESGLEDWRTVGSRYTTSKSNTIGLEQAGSQTDEQSRLTGLQKESENVESFTNRKVDEKGESSQFKLDGTAGVGVGGGKGNLQGNVKLEGRGGHEQSNSFTDRNERMNSLTTGHTLSETTSTSTSLILETAYRHTSTSVDNQQNSRIQSQTVGVTKRTVFKWIVKVPPGKVLTPMQMEMNCDGTNVKIPWIKFVLTGENEPLPPVQDYMD